MSGTRWYRSSPSARFPATGAWLIRRTRAAACTSLPRPELTNALSRVVQEFKPDIVHAHNWIYRSYVPRRN